MEVIDVFIKCKPEFAVDTMTVAEQYRLEGEIRGYKRGAQEGFEKGMLSGEYQKAIAVAKKMFLKELDINFIQEITELSEQDLSGLIK